MRSETRTQPAAAAPGRPDWRSNEGDCYVVHRHPSADLRATRRSSTDKYLRSGSLGSQGCSPHDGGAYPVDAQMAPANATTDVRLVASSSYRDARIAAASSSQSASRHSASPLPTNFNENQLDSYDYYAPRSTSSAIPAYIDAPPLKAKAHQIDLLNCTHTPPLYSLADEDGSDQQQRASNQRKPTALQRYYQSWFAPSSDEERQLQPTRRSPCAFSTCPPVSRSGGLAGTATTVGPMVQYVHFPTNSGPPCSRGVSRVNESQARAAGLRPEQFRYRRLEPRDYEDVAQLHREWFPVR